MVYMTITTKTTNEADNIFWITEYQLFEAIIHQADLCKTKAPEYAECERQLIEEHGLKENKELKGFFKAAWSHYQTLKSKKKGSAYILQGASDLAVQMEKDQSASVPSEPSKK